MPVDIERIRRLSPAALDIFRKQAEQRARTGDPDFARLVSMPEYQSLFSDVPRVQTQQTPLWQKGLQTFGAPFQWIHEKVAEPFGAVALSTFSPSTQETSNLPWFQRELGEYRSWKAPWGVKGAVELLPWLALPGIGQVGKVGFTAGKFAPKGIAGALGKKGIAGKVAGKALELSPWGLAEKATIKAVGLAGKGISKVIAPKVIKLMPDLQDFNQTIEIASRPDNLRKLAGVKAFQGISRILGGKSAVMRTVDEQAIVGRQILLNEGETKTVALMARLKQLGNQDSVFGKVGEDGRFATGEAQGILQNELFTYPDKYVSRLNSTQKQWLGISNEIDVAKLSFLKRNGVKVKERKFEDGGVYAGQRVMGKVNAEGELQDIAYIGAGGMRPGAKPSFLKTRIFTNPKEAAEKGYRYLTRDEAQTLNVQGAYNFVANKKMADWLLERLPHRTAGATELTRAKRLAGSISRMRTKSIPYVAQKEGEWVVAWKGYLGRKPTNQEMRLLSQEAPEFANRIRKVASKEELDLLHDEAQALLQKTQLEWNALSPTEQTARRAYARTARLEEATVQAPAFQGKILTGVDAQKTAELLNKEFSPQYSEALAAVNRVNAVGRYFALSGDMSPFGIQLIFMPWTQPKAYVESVKGFVKSFGDKNFLSSYIARNADVINDSPNLLIAAFEPTEAMRAAGILTKLPGIRNILEPFTRAYDAAMTVAGVEMKKALRHLATTPERIADVDAFINELRGVISTSKLGISMTQRQGESALLLAPKYFRAFASLMVDVFKGGIRGSLARDALLKSAVGMSAMTVAVSYALGEDEEDILQHLDPRSPRFMTWQIAGQNIGPGSKMRSVLKLIGDSTKDPEDLFRLSMENPALRWTRGNFAPALSTGMDLLTGRNYIGEPTRDGMLSLSKTVIGENLVPIWVQSVIWEGGDLGERGVRGVAEFGGGRAYPMTPYQELEEARNTEAQKAYDMDWNEVKTNMGELYQLRLEKANPELRRLKEVAQKESSKMATGETAIWDSWNRVGQTIEDRYRKAITSASEEFEQTWDGATFRKKVDDTSLVRREMYLQREQSPEFESVTQYFNQPLTSQQVKSMNPLDLARREYFKAMYAPDMYDQYGNYQFDLADQRETQFVGAFGQDALDYIHSFGGMKWEEPQALKSLREARQVLQPYWEVENQIWSQMPPQLKQIADQINMMERTDPTQAKRMLFAYPQIVWARKQIAQMRKYIKMTNPEIQNALLMFYRY